jgi:hypothetical protein
MKNNSERFHLNLTEEEIRKLAEVFLILEKWQLELELK